MKSIKVCEYSKSRSFHDDLILQDQASGEPFQDQWSSGCKCENKNADQLCSNCEADQGFCFCYIDSLIPLLIKLNQKFHASSLLL